MRFSKKGVIGGTMWLAQGFVVSGWESVVLEGDLLCILLCPDERKLGL